jgi:cobalt-zinc-cadmium efflux system outer membrane protein
MNQKTIQWLAVLAICGSASGSEEKTNQSKPADSKTVPVVSEEAPKPVSLTLNLKNIGEAIRRFNPDLAAAQLRIDEARGRVRQSGLLTNPKLVSQYGQDPTFGELGGQIGFSQAFPVTDRLRLEKEITQAEVAVAEAEVADVERRLIGDGRLATVQYLAVQQQKDLRVRQLRVAKELADYTDGIATKGEGSPLDAAQARLETTSQQLIGVLKPLIGMTPDGSLSLAGTLAEVSMPAMENLDLQQRKDFEAAQFSVIAAGRAVELEQARKWQDITAGLFAGAARREDAPSGLVAEQRIGFQISIPLPIWNKNQGAIEESKARQRRLELSVLAMGNRIRNEVQTAYRLMGTQTALANEIETRLLPDSQKQVDNTISAYRNGLVNLLTVLRARDQYLRLQSGLLTARQDFHLARVRYETALGKIQ